MRELYNRTLKLKEDIINGGFRYEEIWECDPSLKNIKPQRGC